DLADVWLELRKALNAIADPMAPRRRVVRARILAGNPQPAEEGEAGEPAEEAERGEGEVAGS
ncbi:MAG: hypothetical protein ACRDNW_27815, partial [Trebonia sp.]